MTAPLGSLEVCNISLDSLRYRYVTFRDNEYDRAVLLFA